MILRHLLLITLLLLTTPVHSGQRFNAFTNKTDFCVNLQETDGTPANVQCGTFNFDNGTITDNADGSFTHSIAGFADSAYLRLNAANDPMQADLDLGGFDLDDVGDIALDTISSATGTTVIVNLGQDSGNDFRVVSNSIAQLQVEGDTGLTTFQNIETLSTNGTIIPASTTFAFTRTGDSDTGVEFDVTNTRYNFKRDNITSVAIDASNPLTYSLRGFISPALLVPDNFFIVSLADNTDTGLHINTDPGTNAITIKLDNVIKHSLKFDGDYIAGQDITSIRNLITGSGVAGVDYTRTIRGENSIYIETWDEGNDVLKISDEHLFVGTEKLHFLDAAIGIYSQADTFLDLFADGAVRIGDSSAGAPTNYVNIQPNGEIQLVGTARVVKQIPIANANLGKGATKATQVILGRYNLWVFGINDDAVFTFHIPHDWDPSTDIDLNIDWLIDEAGGDEIKWQISWAATPHNSSEAIDTPTHTGSSDTGDIVVPATVKFLTQNTLTIPASSLSAEDQVGVELKRIAITDGTNPTSEPGIVDVHIEYTANKLGE